MPEVDEDPIRLDHAQFHRSGPKGRNMQTKEPGRRSDHSPKKTAVSRSHLTLRQRPAGRPPPAKLQGQRCGARSRRIPPLQLPAQRSGQREQSAPLFGLTCASMHGMRLRWARHSGRFSALLLSGSVLLAFACFPVVAEADSAGTQYENEVPTPTGTHKVPGPSAQTSAVGGGASPRGP